MATKSTVDAHEAAAEGAAAAEEQDNKPLERRPIILAYKSDMDVRFAKSWFSIDYQTGLICHIETSKDLF